MARNSRKIAILLLLFVLNQTIFSEYMQNISRSKSFVIFVLIVNTRSFEGTDVGSDSAKI